MTRHVSQHARGTLVRPVRGDSFVQGFGLRPNLSAASRPRARNSQDLVCHERVALAQRLLRTLGGYYDDQALCFGLIPDATPEEVLMAYGGDPTGPTAVWATTKASTCGPGRMSS